MLYVNFTIIEKKYLTFAFREITFKQIKSQTTDWEGRLITELYYFLVGV